MSLYEKVQNLPHKRLERLVWNSDRDINRRWAEDELYAISSLDLSEMFLDALDAGEKTSNEESSTVAYAIGLTDEEPTMYPKSLKVYKGRVSPPDIDLDFDDRRREEVINYAKRKYGEERVAHIGTFSRERAKAAIKDCARVLDFPYSSGNELSKLMPEAKLGVVPSLSDALAGGKFRKEYDSDEESRSIIDAALSIEGIVRQTGVHAAGVVIARGPVSDYVPTMQRPVDKSKELGPLTTQWDMHKVEDFGLLKVDFLGLRNLGVFDMTVKNIKETRGIDIDLNKIPLDDELTYSELRKGNSIGCFQIEGSGMRQMMVSLQPERLEDIMALIALYRPGPLGSGMHEIFIDRKHGRRNIKSYHPSLDEVLESSYGIMLYQEDVLNVARKLAGFSAVEADALRKAIGKKLMDKIGEYRAKFVEGCLATHDDITEDLANEIFSDIEFFGGYGFNRAHSASYAMVSYISAYFKFNYPSEYMAALLTSIGSGERVALYLNECRRMGISVLPPSINRSMDEYKVESNNDILFGLGSIKGIGPAVVADIMDCRDEENPYYSIHDFMRRCNPSLLNKAILEHLFRSGAMDELVPEQPRLMLTRDEKTEILDHEREELGLFLTEHPLVGVWGVLEPNVDCVIAELEEIESGERVTVGGILSEVRPHVTKSGKDMFYLKLEDLTATIEVLVFSTFIKDNDFNLGDIVLITGKVEHEGDDDNVVSKMIFFSMVKPSLPEYAAGEPIIITCDYKPEYGTIKNINNVIKENPGDTPVYIRFPDAGATVSLKFKRPTQEGMLPRIQELIQEKVGATNEF